MKRWLVQSGAYCVAAAAVMIFIGIEWWRALVIAACAFAVVASMRWWPVGWYGQWPKQPQRSYGGGTYQVRNLDARLANRRGRRRSPDLALQHRLRGLAISKLARCDLTWHESPTQIESALGTDVYAALRAETFDTDLRATARIVSAIENLRPQDPHQHSKERAGNDGNPTFH